MRKSVNLDHVAIVEDLQLQIKKLKYEKDELLEIVKGYRQVSERSTAQFEIIVSQRDQFMELAKSLDKKLGGEIFN
tara:strand:+ start:187 stop:414 length:228 start_codon:yes stop_codon:yes gene_type:complete